MKPPSWGYLETLYFIIRFDFNDLRSVDILRAIKRLFEIDPIKAVDKISIYNFHKGLAQIQSTAVLSDDPEAQSLANDILNYK